MGVFLNREIFGDKFATTVTRTRRLTYTEYKNLAVFICNNVLSVAPVLMAINSINTLRTRLCLGICFTWLKMKLVNISLYTVIDIHEYREILEKRVQRGVIAGLVRVPLISSLIGCLLHACADWPLERFPGMCVGPPDCHQKFLRNSSATIRALALTDSFISLISLSISSMKWMT